MWNALMALSRRRDRAAAVRAPSRTAPTGCGDHDPGNQRSMAPSVADAAKTCRRRLEVAPTAVEAAAALILVRIGLWTMPFAMLSRVVERICARRRQGADGGPDRIGRIVGAGARGLPLRTTGLVG